MQIKNVLFEKVLLKNNITKKEFSNYSKIPYDTVLGWRKKGTIPPYAMVILKDMNYRKRVDTETLGSFKDDMETDLTIQEQNRLKSAFWGTNYTIGFIIKEIKKGNQKILNKLKQNLSLDMQNQILGKLCNA